MHHYLKGFSVVLVISYVLLSYASDNEYEQAVVHTAYLSQSTGSGVTQAETESDAIGSINNQSINKQSKLGHRSCIRPACYSNSCVPGIQSCISRAIRAKYCS